VVSARHNAGESLIILRPNRSADWRANRNLLLSLAALSCVISTGFALLGAWMILPFAGLEIAVLGGALYYVCWKLSYRQVITLRTDSLSIDKGVYRPRRSWHFDRAQASVAVHPSGHPHTPPRISFCVRGEFVEIGEFLSREEGLRLLSTLRHSGLRVTDHGMPYRKRF